MHTKNKICVNRSFLFLFAFGVLLILGVFAVNSTTLNQPKSYSSRASRSQQAALPTAAPVPPLVDLLAIARQIVSSPDGSSFAPILSLLFHAQPQQIVNATTYGSIPPGAMTAAISPEQRQIIAQVFDSNSVQSYTNLNISPTIYFGLSQCSDSRCVQPSTLFGQNGQVIELIQSNKIAAQPTFFPSSTAGSFFITHVNECNAVSGCGALGGISVLLKNETEGINALKAHNVPDDTITALKALIQKGVGANAQEWALMGARIQADMNNHAVVAVVSGHADNSFQVLGVVLPRSGGIVKSIDAYPQLKEVSMLLTNPLPLVNPKLAIGQTPKVIAINFSRTFGTEKLYGPLQQTAGTVFKVGPSNLKTVALTVNEIDDIAASGGYGLSALKNGKVAIITADTISDLNLVRARLAFKSSTNGIDDFLKQGGVIISALINPQSGKIGKYVILETAADTFGAEKPFLQELSRGAYMITDRVKLFFSSTTQKFVNSAFAASIMESTHFKRLQATFEFMKVPVKLLGRVIGSTADIFTLIQLSQTFTNVIGLGVDTNAPPVRNFDLCPDLSKCSFTLSRTYLVQEHSLALLKYLSNGKYGNRQKEEPWASMESGDVGKNITVEFLSDYGAPLISFRSKPKYKFILRTASPYVIDAQGNVGTQFMDLTQNPSQPIMLVSPHGFMVSDVAGSETYTLSYTDESLFDMVSGIFKKKGDKPYIVWRVTAKPDTDDVLFTAVGKVLIDDTGTKITETKLKW